MTLKSEYAISFSSQNRLQRLSKDQQRQLLETGEKTIHEIIQPKSTNLYGNCFKVKSFKCPMSMQTPSWAEKTRIPAEGGLFVCLLV